jgi:hypothetical protein
VIVFPEIQVYIRIVDGLNIFINLYGHKNQRQRLTANKLIFMGNQIENQPHGTYNQS